VYISKLKLISFNLLRILAIATGLYSLAFIFFDSIGDPKFHEKISTSPIMWCFHLFGGGLSLIVSTFAISEHVRIKYLELHKLMGKVYVISIVFASIGGFFLAFNSESGAVSGFAFGILSIIWFYSTLMAFIKIKSKKIIEHKVWMYRSFALTIGAVFLRIEVPFIMMLSKNNWVESFGTVAWLSWVPSLIITEWFIIEKFKR
jgi:uncharacterized membrane protein